MPSVEATILQPEPAAGAAARDAPALRADAQLPQKLERVAQAVGDALEDGAGERRAAVLEPEAGERGACVRVRVRRPLAGEVREEQHARRHPARRPRPPREARRTRRPAANASRNQRSEPAAESITPIACQVPGTAWQKTCRRASGSGAYAGSAAKTTPEVPRTTESGPGPATPTPSAPAAWSPAPAATGVPFACSAGDFGRLQGRGQPLGRELERLEYLAAPAPLGDVEEERPGGIGDVGRALTRKA